MVVLTFIHTKNLNMGESNDFTEEEQVELKLKIQSTSSLYHERFMCRDLNSYLQLCTLHGIEQIRAPNLSRAQTYQSEPRGGTQR